MATTVNEKTLQTLINALIDLRRYAVWLAQHGATTEVRRRAHQLIPHFDAISMYFDWCPRAEAEAELIRLRTEGLTLREYARRVGVHPVTARRWAEAGQIPGAYKTPGGHWRVPALSAAPRA